MEPWIPWKDLPEVIVEAASRIYSFAQVAQGAGKDKLPYIIQVLGIPKALLDIISSVFGFTKIARSEEKDRLQRIAQILGKIADCIERIIDASRKKDWGTLIADIPQYLVPVDEFSGGCRMLLVRGERHATCLPESNFRPSGPCCGDVR